MPEQLGGGRSVEPRWFTNIRRGLFTALGLSLFGLAASGLYLVFRYQPTSGDAGFGRVNTGVTKPALLGFAEAAHVVSGVIALIVTVLLVANVAVPAVKRSWVSILAWVAGSSALVGALWYGLAKGRQLAWTQAALWAVTTGTGLRGVLSSTDEIRFYLLGSDEVGAGTFRQHVWIHIAVLPLIIVIAFGLLVFASWKRRRPEQRPAPAPRDGVPEREFVRPG